jgi:hypothetical protein
VAGGQFIQVYLNGVLLKLTDDYTAANGSDIVLTSGAATGDILEFITFADFTVNNQNFTGGLTVDNDGSTVLTVDRATSDGTIIDLQKSGSSVGSIQSRSGVVSTIVLNPAGTDGAGLTGGTDTVAPTNGLGTITNGDLDLGFDNGKFRDIYLSGGVFLGGTGSANKISDYETGNWTPAVSSGTINSSGGTYTKIGRLVHCAVVFDTVSDTSSGTAFQISGLPFDADPNGNSWGSSMWKNNGSGKHICYIAANNKVYFYHSSTSGAYSYLTHSQLTSGAGAHVFFTYTTSA